MGANRTLTDQEKQDLVCSALTQVTSYVHSALDYMGASSMSGTVEISDGTLYEVSFKKINKDDKKDGPNGPQNG